MCISIRKAEGPGGADRLIESPFLPADRVIVKVSSFLRLRRHDVRRSCPISQRRISNVSSGGYPPATDSLLKIDNDVADERMIDITDSTNNVTRRGAAGYLNC